MFLPIVIRQERTRDSCAVRRVVENAFSGPVEADLVDTLRINGKLKLSLVAELEDQIVGHILFTEVTIEGACARAVGLAPLAVLAPFQRKGIGSALTLRGLEQCRDLGYEAIFVLGHSDFYPKFGFIAAGQFGLRCEYEVPPEVVMAIELRPGALQGRNGLVRYQPEFGGV